MEYDYEVVFKGFKHYVCKRCGSYFASLSDLLAHFEVCERLLMEDARSPSKKARVGWLYE